MYTKVISWVDAAKDGDLWLSAHRLRKRQFVDRLDYAVSSCDGLEYDQFDTPAARYVVCYNDRRSVLGCVRLIPTTRPFMLAVLWSELLAGRTYCEKSVWEASRITVDKDEAPYQRKLILLSLIEAVQLYGLKNGISKYLGVMYPAVWRRTLISHGCEVSPIGETSYDGKLIQSKEIYVSKKILNAVHAHRISAKKANAETVVDRLYAYPKPVQEKSVNLPYSY